MTEVWDAIVIGAGPAGAVTVRELGRSGFRVLLVDKANFPRQKVCGCCINGTAMELLQRLGLGSVLDDAVPLNRVSIRAGKRSADVILPRGVALSREVFDARLVEEAVKSGVVFRPLTLAKLGEIQADVRAYFHSTVNPLSLALLSKPPASPAESPLRNTAPGLEQAR